MTIEDKVRNALHARADLVGSADVMWERIGEDAVAHGNGARERLVAAVVAAAVAIAGIGVIFVALRPAPGPPTSQYPGPVLREIQVGAGPGRIATGFGSIWVAMPDRVVRVDPDIGQVQAEVKVRGITPSGTDLAFFQYGGDDRGSSLAPAGGFMWVAAEPRIVGIDPGTNEVARQVTDSSSITNIAPAGQVLLVGAMAEGSGDLRLIDPLAKGSIYLDSRSSFTDAFPAVLATEHWYWAASSTMAGPSAVSRWATDYSSAQHVIVPAIRSLTSSDDSVWFTGEDSLYRVEAGASGEGSKGQKVEPDLTVALDAPSIVAGDETGLWLLETGATSSRLMPLSPDTGEPLSPPVTIEHGGPAEMVVSDGLPLITFRDDGVLVSFGDPRFGLEQSHTSAPSVAELPANGMIAFSSGPGADIFVIGTDGADPTHLVSRHAEDQQAGLQMAWSPDGTKIAFTDYRRSGSVGLFVMDAVGGTPLDVSPSLEDAESPSWSPDGTRLAFGGCCDAGYEAYVVGADGTGLHRVTDEVDDNGGDGAFSPIWSPDGSRLACVVTRYESESLSETMGILIVRLDGGSSELITQSPHIDESPVWSPDGTKIAFLRKTPRGLADVFVVSAVDGVAEPIQLSSPLVHATSGPRWSPDSLEVLFSGQRVDNDNHGIYVAGADGAGDRVVIEDAYAQGPVWSPDGRWIVFVRDDAGSGLLAVSLMRPDGTDVLDLAGGFEELGGIEWQSSAKSN